MPHPLTDHLSPTPIHAPCAVRVGGHSFGFGAQFFAIATVPNGGVGGRPVAPVPCDRSSATNSNPEGHTQDGAELGVPLSAQLGANFQTNLHEDASA
ncbi:hypothetical protein ACKU27_05315 [Sphingobium yanoikuyae]|uniref:hypothetical protein n=1 Tax=Sphingobium yanoikuyae TaxID=13690 RepID=UPI003B8F429F